MVQLSSFDVVLIVLFFAITLFIGIYVSKQSGKSAAEFFLSGRNMPWWLLGVSMVATTFSTDTPNLVTDIVRTNGVSGNWVWWAFLLTGLLTVFVYAKLWRKSEVSTDIEFYELRYGGAPARFLRGFRAIYLGIIFNILAMSAVTLAAVKIGAIMLGLQPWETVIYAGTITVVFSALGGFKGVVYTDFILFFTAMAGALGAAYYLVGLPEVGGLEALLQHENVVGKLNILPDFSNTEALITLLIIPLAVQWWSSWYPGAEPGGGGYIAQRMLAAKNENHAIGATFFFNIMHYALRPWPWIIVALASLVVFPDIASIHQAFPLVAEDKLGHDLAYSAMLTKLPSGLLGLVLASLVAAYMSTISTHLNWGASYVVNDFYKQQINKNATEKQLVTVGRLATVTLMVCSALLALVLTNALQLFDIILMFGAGTGLIFILRWFWWRINAWSEISAMFVSGIVSILLNFTDLGIYFFGEEGLFPTWAKFPMIVLVTTIVWVAVTFLTQAESKTVLQHFYKKTQPGGPGWQKIVLEARQENIELENTKAGWSVPSGILAMLVGCALIYSIMFATGYIIYGNYLNGLLLIGAALIFALLLMKLWKKIKVTIL
ncbi:MAG: Na+:solute symporter [Xanthomarina sp.]|uniref:sodium:solute symporter family protein n=1 Tax=Xanthomarina sp. TaxID=1931211 RepID=UPI000C5D3BF7|nr:sodium:solute symporter family protein [Xanthomarina sp.]MAL22320.1 Na+:solute symporter [Xanthomarina sp.]MBF60858.1 Na+:solute symporter [Xanthomarina sp.]HAB27288.1 Na+:solute symporter [Xanthomarina gelatinilytica]|tara:strand:- start:477 stop:2288 length:1812 start_codon:yes stop_codon:yes gene_type:complete